MGNDTEFGRLTGSKATPEAPSGLRPSGYDPERETLSAIEKLLFLALTLEDEAERRAAVEAAHDISVSAQDSRPEPDVLAPVAISENEWWFFSPDGRKWIAKPEGGQNGMATD